VLSSTLYQLLGMSSTLYTFHSSVQSIESNWYKHLLMETTHCTSSVNEKAQQRTVKYNENIKKYRKIQDTNKNTGKYRTATKIQ